MMDWILIIIAFGFILCGVIIGLPLGFSAGQRHILCKIDRQNRRQSPSSRRNDEILESEYIEEVKR